MPKDKPIEVEIIDAHEITEYPLGREPTTTVIVTYRVGAEAPRSIFIPKDQDTPENRAKLIREDWQKASSFKPETIKV